MKRWKVWASIVALFAAGFLIGSAGTAFYIKHVMDTIIDGGPPAVRRVVMKKLTRNLKLTTDQREKVEEVVRTTQEKLIEIRLKNEPIVDKVVREGADEAKEYLDEGQREKLDSMLEKARSRWMLSGKEEEHSSNTQ